jgi:N-acetylmuramic acid 6-phosphate etherase/N-acetylglucosamine-6-phosphate deacetylase
MLIAAPALLRDGKVTGPGVVEIAGGVIIALHEHAPPDCPIITLDRGILAPGLIDLHVNGAFGIDCARASPADMAHLARELAARGTTSFLATIITAPIPDLLAASAHLADVTPITDGADLLGLHLEGPFIAPSRRGAHPLEALAIPDPDLIDHLLRDPALRRILRLVTLAPELPGGLAAISRLTQSGCTVALGHSDADASMALRAIDAGARLVTHVFNAMRGLHHRDPGLIGVALSDPRLWPCFIADLVHVDPVALRVGFAAAGSRAIAVTDSICLAGLPEGSTQIFGGAPAWVRDGAARRDDGALCGAVITLDQAVRRLIAQGIPPGAALAAASETPAGALGLLDRGRIAPGLRADLVWLDDDYSLRETWIKGRAVLGRAPQAATPRQHCAPTERIHADPLALDSLPSEQIIAALLNQEQRSVQALGGSIAHLALLADRMAATIAQNHRVITLGAGTSGRLAVLDAVECGPTFGLPPGVLIPVLAGGPAAVTSAIEGAEDDGAAAIAALHAHQLTHDDLVIGIAASGNTEFVRAGLAAARALGCTTAAISNNPDGKIVAVADIVVILPTGAEILAGSTRLSAGTAQKIALNALSTTAMIRLGKVYGPYMVDMRPTNAKLHARACNIVAALAGCSPADAAVTLGSCGDQIKIAVIMQRLGVTAQTAQARLDAAGGHLRTVIGAVDLQPAAKSSLIG